MTDPPLDPKIEQQIKQKTNFQTLNCTLNRPSFDQPVYALLRAVPFDIAICSFTGWFRWYTKLMFLIVIVVEKLNSVLMKS